MEAIKESGSHLLGLINDVLEISKVEAGKIEIKPDYFVLHHLLEKIVKQCQNKMISNKNTIQIVFDHRFPNYIKMDPFRLEQILVNLVHNACKFTENGKITITTVILNKQDEFFDFEMRVKDTGIGISPEDKTFIFEQFEQHKGFDVAYGGTGLGLTIVKELCDLMHGTIFIEDNLPTGSIFVVRFRAIEFRGDPMEASAKKSNVHLPVLPAMTLLIVDDQSMNRMLLHSYFEGTKVRVIEAENGKEAIAMTRQHRPNMILMDIRMPVMNGIEATRVLKSERNPSDIPVIGITGDVLNQEKYNGFAAIMHKPVSQEKLFKKIRSLLNR